MTSSIVKTVIFTILVPGTVAVIVPRNIASDAATPTLLSSIGFLPMALGAAIYFWCAWDFAVAGQGTPAPVDAPKHLVVRALYRFVRNPMYVGIQLVLTGESAAFRSLRILIYAAIVFVFFSLFVILYEEPALTRKFGAEYEQYKRSVSQMDTEVTAPFGRGSVRARGNVLSYYISSVTNSRVISAGMPSSRSASGPPVSSTGSA
jgi:protein-S-isoprenylcysteine O-methyltransferase Ste14